jgi:hypothetical protein
MAPLDFNAPTPEEKAEIRRRKAAITRRIKREVYTKYGIERLPKEGDRTLVTGGQGTGKSRTTAQRIATLKGEAAIWWMVPTLEKAAEQAEEYTRARTTDSMTARVVRGRGAPDPRTDGVEPMCPRHGVVTRAASMGVNVQEAICNGGCPLRFSCGFQRQQTDLRDHPSGLFLMASDYLWLPCPAPQPDIVIADESLIEKATEIISLDPARIVDDQKWACPNDLDSAMAMRQTAILVRAAVVEHPGRELAFLRSYEVTDAALKECVQHLVSKEEAKPEVNGSMTDKQISAALDMVEAREILKVLKLFRQIRREFAQPRNRLNSVWFDPEHRVMVAGEVERHPRVFVSHVKTPRLRKETPVLALDGTGSIVLNRKVFGNHMTLERFAAPRDAKVYQVTGKTFSRQSITGTNRDGTPRTNRNMSEAAALRAQVVEFLDMIPGDVLLVSYKAAIEALIDDLPPHVTTAHFGGLRGLNSFEHCETVVVMGREQPSAQAIEALTRPFTATDAEPFMPVGEYVDQSRGRRTRDDTEPNIVVAQVHFDPRCQIVLEQIREAEMVQAIDRVRPIFNHRKVFVLNNLPLDLTVDRVMTWPEMRASRLVRAFARHGVLPISPRDLTRCFYDLFKDEKTASNAIYACKKTTLESQIIYLFGVLGLFFGHPLKATYRRKGQRGPLACALVRSDLSDPRSVLEGMVGELVEFQVERPPQPPGKADAPDTAAQRLPPLPPLAAAMSAEAHLLATLPPDQRPPDLLGMARVMKLVALAAGPERAAAA